MKRSKKLCFGLLLVFSIMFGSFLNVSSDVSALDDFTYVIDSSNSSSFVNKFLCNNGYGSGVPNCSDYSYIIIDITSDVYPRNNFLYSVTYPGVSTQNHVIPFVYRKTVYNFSDVTVFSVRSVSSTYTSNFSITITFTQNNPFGSLPTGNLDITENGEYDVINYATVTVNVENEVIQGDYHDDLVSINNSILIVAAVGLVIYFFYAIYRMILGGRR